MRMLISLLLLLCTACTATAQDAQSNAENRPAAEAKVDFARDVLPILKMHCIRCHGSERREGGLRLDEPKGAATGGDSGAVIIPGNGNGSPLVARITSADETTRMPREADQLPENEITLLRDWINAGAVWPGDLAKDLPQAGNHWSFRPLERVPVPAVTRQAWVRNPIDSFVLSALESHGWSPAPEADRYTLIRRVYLDLIGLPPTPEEADAFALDVRPDAYERVVDQLLADPAYGERWARRWLDLARYADTNGYEKDRQRTIWPYRDWVVNALNHDLPFDQFSIEQLAGDMLPGATEDQRIATGFHRNTMTNEEGGIDVEEFRFASLVDRVNTTGTVWLGLSVGCAQCHSHKYDPITQREYYQLLAYFNHCDEPELVVPSESVAAAIAESNKQITALREARRASLPDLTASGVFAAWEKSISEKASNWTIVSPQNVVSMGNATMTVLPDASVLVSGDKPNRDTYVVEIPLMQSGYTAIRLEVLPHESLPDMGPGRAPLFQTGDFLLSEIRAELGTPETNDTWQKISIASGTESFAQEGRKANLCFDGDLDTGWSIQGRAGEESQAVFSFAVPLEAPGKTLRLTLDQFYIHQMTIGRFRLSLTQDQGMRVASGVSASVEAAIKKSASERTPQEQLAIEDTFLSMTPELAEQNKKISELARSVPKHATTLVMQERPAQYKRTTHVHHRGEFLRTTEAVEADVPGLFKSDSSEQPRDRLAFAQWLFSRENPLAARVAVNRNWEAMFGRGLVRTTDDFGTRGEAPSNPALLDYLANEYIKVGWRSKALHRMIVTSATYRQSSSFSASTVEHDRENFYLARGPRIRLDAEVIHDLPLFASGLLANKRGGPPVYPPQPAGVAGLAYGGGAWPTSTGEDRYRRGLYTFAKRTVPFPVFGLFDAPSGENCRSRRDRSNTPTQALSLLNDTLMLEAARGLANRAIASGSRSREGIAMFIFRRVLTRNPDQQELDWIVAYFDAQLGRCRTGGLDAVALTGKANSEEAQGMDLNEWAAWTCVARAILNLDEAIMKE